MLPSTLKCLCSVEPVRMHFPAKQPCTNDNVCNAACSIAHSIICTVRLFRGEMHSDWFNGIEILQGKMATLRKKWDTFTPTDLERLFVSGTYMSRWSRRVKERRNVIPNMLQSRPPVHLRTAGAVSACSKNLY